MEAGSGVRPPEEAALSISVARLALCCTFVAAGTVLIAAGAEALLPSLGRRTSGLVAASSSLAWAYGLVRATKLDR